MDWAERIEKIEATLRLNTADLARKIDIPPRYLYEIKNGKSKNPSITFLDLLVKRIRLNPAWFFSDDTEMFQVGYDPSFPNRDEVRKEEKTEEVFQEIEAAIEPDDEGIQVLERPRNVLTPVRLNGRHAVEVAVNNIDPDVAFVGLVRGQLAGAGPAKEISGDLDIQSLRIERRFLQPWRPDQVRALEIKGDSMTKIGLFDRDIVLFVPEEREGDGVYVISGAYGLQCKRLEFDIVDRKLRIISENDRYQPRILEGEEADRIVIEGKVIGWLHRHPY